MSRVVVERAGLLESAHRVHVAVVDSGGRLTASVGDAARPDYPLWEGCGRDVCGAVYSGQYERLRENIRALHPDLEQ